MKLALLIFGFAWLCAANSPAWCRHLDKSSSPAELKAAIDYLDSVKTPSAEQYFTKGKVQSWLKDWNAAVDSMSRSIELSPTADAYGIRALCYRHLEKYSEALADCNKAEELGYKNGDLLSMRGLIKLSLRDYAGALKDAERAVRLNDKDASGFYVKGSAEYRLNETSKSIESLTKSIVLNPLARPSFEARSLAYKKLGNIKAAEADLKTANGLKW